MTTVTTEANGNQTITKVQGEEAGVEKPQVTPPVTEGDPNKTNDGRPEWLDPKFKTVEDLQKSYHELEKKLGQGNKEATPPVAENKPPEQSKLQIEAEAAVQKAGLNMKELEAEYIAKGELSKESLDKLKASGIDEAQIEVYKRGLEAQNQDYENKILEGIEGGRETLDEAMQWAAKNLSKEKIDSFNKAVSQGDPNIGQLAVRGLIDQYIKSDGPNLIGGGRMEDQQDVYQSMAQLTKDMQDPLYQKDPAFRAKVEAKVARSDYSKFK